MRLSDVVPEPQELTPCTLIVAWPVNKLLQFTVAVVLVPEIVPADVGDTDQVYEVALAVLVVVYVVVPTF
jgi:hypothetical protein